MDTTNTVVNGGATIGGLHHVTAIAGNGQRNVDFYTQVMGLRLVKATVNYDDPASYHLYYGDRTGTPGTLITFFVWEGGFGGKRGTGEVSQTAYAIPVGAVDFWKTRLAELNVPVTESVRFGERVLSLTDPDGLAVELIGTELSAWDGEKVWSARSVPAEMAIRGLHSVTLTEVNAGAPAAVLVELFGYRRGGAEGNRERFVIGEAGGLARVVDVVSTGQRGFVGGGAGSVHHVAFRTPTDAQQETWLKTLREIGAHVSPVMDRDYFHSIYFREPGGVLFEIATDTPGMLVKEPVEELGTKLALPEWLESQRVEIEKGLPRLNVGTTTIGTREKAGV